MEGAVPIQGIPMYEQGQGKINLLRSMVRPGFFFGFVHAFVYISSSRLGCVPCLHVLFCFVGSVFPYV